MASTTNYLDVSALTSNLNTGYNNEEIVVDDRAAYTPVDLVQQKLQGLLPSASIPVSCLHTGRQVRRYNTWSRPRTLLNLLSARVPRDPVKDLCDSGLW